MNVRALCICRRSRDETIAGLHQRVEEADRSSALAAFRAPNASPTTPNTFDSPIVANVCHGDPAMPAICAG